MEKQVTLTKQIIAVVIFVTMIFCGLFLPIIIFDTPEKVAEYTIPVEVIMVISAFLVSAFIMIFTNKKWEDIFEKIIESIKSALPGLLILLVIGPLIAAFIMSGLMPMLVYYGIKLIDPRFLYFMAFVLAALFSTFTGTSWGSAATIGVVMMGITTAVDANMAITAGAVIGGAYFGDKMSPLSDTTNIAAIASGVNLYDHIQSMLWTTIPSSIIASTIFLIMGFVDPAKVSDLNDPTITTLLSDLSSMFSFKFGILLIIPLIVVLVGSFKKKPVLPVMAVAAAIGFIFAIIFQGFKPIDVISGLGNGFTLDMVSWYTPSEPVEGVPYVLGFFERGGFWELGGLLPISISILTVVGVLNTVEAMQGTVNAIFGWAKTRATIIVSSLATAIAMIALTANGIACSFVTAEIFKKKYDDANIDRRVLSRTTEDAGTLLEVLFPWTPAAIFFTATLGVEVSEYAPWAIMNWSTSLVAVVLAVTGIGTFKKAKEIYNDKKELKGNE